MRLHEPMKKKSWHMGRRLRYRKDMGIMTGHSGDIVRMLSLENCFETGGVL